MWGTTILRCEECWKEYECYGWLPTTIQIYAGDEGLLCCDEQVIPVNWVRGKR